MVRSARVDRPGIRPGSGTARSRATESPREALAGAPAAGVTVKVEGGSFNGLACRWLSNGLVRLAVTTGRGPRLLFWGWQSGDNVLAEVPGKVERTADGVYEFLGGHRLWYAPEALERTYAATPDPKWVVAVGNCAENGGIFAGSYAVEGGVSKVIPVDLYIRGCPPDPITLLKCLLALIEGT